MSEESTGKTKKSKKEKKRSLSITEIPKDSVEHNPDSLSIENLVPPKKKKSKAGKDKLNLTSMLPSQDDSVVEASVTGKKKKKKKKEKLEDENSLVGEGDCKSEENSQSLQPLVQETDELSLPSEKRKKHKKGKGPVDTAEQGEEEDFIKEKESKKAKKQKQCESTENGCQNPSINDLNVSKPEGANHDQTFERKKKKKKRDKKLDNDISNCCEENVLSSTDKKVKKNKKKRKKEIDDADDLINLSSEGNSVQLSEKKSKKNKSKRKQADVPEAGSGSFDVDKNRLKYESGNTEGELISNDIGEKKKRKRSLLASGTDVIRDGLKKVRTEANGNGDSGSLPAEPSPSENSSCDPVGSESTGSTGGSSQAVTTGQWQGDLFDSAERQSKFLRLLGGMKKSGGEGAGDSKKLFKSQSTAPKKGLFGSLASRVGGGNAMTVSDAASLNQRLEEDYNRAMDFKLSKKKGTGFGFVADPAEGKKFHIDVNKTNSVKFDD